LGDYEGEHLIIQDLEEVQKNAQRLGLPVIMGEWGSVIISRGGSGQSIRNRNRIQHAEEFARIANELGMVVLWWDNNSFTDGDHTFGLIPRAYPHTISDHSQEIINAIMRAHGRHEYIADIPEPTPAESPAPAQAEEEQEIAPEFENEVTENEKNGFNAWIWIAIIGIALAVPAFVLAFKKKK
jgi:hypothetical protein